MCNERCKFMFLVKKYTSTFPEGQLITQGSKFWTINFLNRARKTCDTFKYGSLLLFAPLLCKLLISKAESFPEKGQKVLNFYLLACLLTTRMEITKSQFFRTSTFTTIKVNFRIEHRTQNINFLSQISPKFTKTLNNFTIIEYRIKLQRSQI